jgi:hypothetical protein
MADEMTGQDGDLRSRVVSLEHTVQGNVQRLAAMETWQRQSDLADARKEGEWKAMNDKIDAVGSKVDKISDSLTWVVRLLVGGIIMAALALLFKSGVAP